MDKVFKPENMARLDNDKRRELIPPHKVLDFMNINKGDILLDVGAGIGYFSFPAMKYVGPGGKVIAADISKEMLEEMKRRSPGNADNLELLLCGPEKISLGDGTADRILMAFVLHEMDGKREYLEELKRILKPGGELTIVEWDKVESPMGPPLHERINHEELKALAAPLGFSEIKFEGMNPYQYLSIQKKK